MKKRPVFLIISLCFLISCVKIPVNKDDSTWESEFDKQLPVLGHRNWILIVDKAFPAQNSEGIITINTGENLQSVLKYTLEKVDQCTHVKPNIFVDKESNFITSAQVPHIKRYLDSLEMTLKNYTVSTIKHDSVFLKIDQASKLFRIVVLKTEEVIPYSSVFIQLNCKYWSADKQKELEKAMKK